MPIISLGHNNPRAWRDRSNLFHLPGNIILVCHFSMVRKMNYWSGLAISFWLFPLILLSQVAASESDLDSFGTSGAILAYQEVKFQWTMQGDVQASLNEGLNDLLEKRPDKAIVQLSDAINKDPQLWMGLYYRAMAYKLTHQFPLAIKDLIDAGTMMNVFQIPMEMGKVYLLMKDYPRATIEFKKAVDIDLSSPLGYYYQGILSMINRDYGSAQDYFKKCEEVNPGFAVAKVRLATIEIEKSNDPNKGLPYLDKAILIDPNLGEARLIRFMILSRSNNENALADIDFLVLHHPINWQLRLMRAIYLVKLKSYDKAFSDLKKVIEASSISENYFIGKNTNVDRKIDIQAAGYYVVSKVYGLSEVDSDLLKKAFCLLVANQFNECIAVLDQIHDSEKTSACMYLKALAYEHGGDREKAEKYYNITLSLDDQIFDAHKKRAIYRTNHQQWQFAIEDFNTMAKINPEAIITYKLRGVARYFLEDYAGAIDDFNHYLLKDSLNMEAFHNRGMTLQKMGKPLEALPDMMKSEKTYDVDWKIVNRALDKILMDGDTAKFWQVVDVTKDLLKLDPTMGQYRILKLKTLWVASRWSEIDERWVEYGKNPEIDYYYHSYFLTVQASRLISYNLLKKAEEMLEVAISYDKLSGPAYYQLGRLMMRLNKPRQAEKNFEKARSLVAPENVKN